MTIARNLETKNEATTFSEIRAIFEVEASIKRLYSILEQPLEEVIEKLYSYDIESIQRFYAKIFRAEAKDLEVAKKKLKELEKLYQEDDCTFINKFLLKILTMLLTDQTNKKINILSETQNLQKSLLTIIMSIYKLNSNYLNQDSELFYLNYLYVYYFDPWSFHTLINSDCFQLLFEVNNPQYIDLNFNALYLKGLAAELSKDKRYFIFAYNEKEIIFPPLAFTIDSHSFLSKAYVYYRNAVATGSDIALTGLARLFSQGIGGVKKNIPYALQLYKLAMKLGVYGALPLNSDNPRILYYSTMLSGMNRLNRDLFIKRSPFPPLATLKIYLMIRMNYADPSVEKTLQKFEALAIKNPNNIFDTLLDQDIDSFKRLQCCVRPALFKAILNRKQTEFKIKSHILEEKKLPPKLISDILSFLTGSKPFLEDAKTCLPKTNGICLFQMKSPRKNLSQDNEQSIETREQFNFTKK